VLEDGNVRVRPLRMRDASAWVEARTRNVEWLREWEASPPEGPAVVPTSLATFVAMTRRLRREARVGLGLPFVVEVGGRFAGQLNVSGVTRGSLHSAHLGYWIDRRFAGRGAMPTAVALVTDHCFGAVGLHRVEVNIRPENAASRRVVDKLGFRDEGLRRRFLHIAGEWRDHTSYALVREEVPGGLLLRWRRDQARRPGAASGELTPDRDTPSDVPPRPDVPG
jgi:ribosomal-protein-alanine N-acetyltransferase